MEYFIKHEKDQKKAYATIAGQVAIPVKDEEPASTQDSVEILPDMVDSSEYVVNQSLLVHGAVEVLRKSVLNGKDAVDESAQDNAKEAVDLTYIEDTDSEGES